MTCGFVICNSNLIFIVFDTHCHLNFKRFKDSIPEVIQRAKEAGVTNILIPGTDIETSQKAVEIASQYKGVYAAVGIHPHHAKEIGIKNSESGIKNLIDGIELFLSNPKVVAVGEVGIDKFQYPNTKYQSYTVDEQFIEAQKLLFIKQIKLALKYDKSLILHNREAKKDLLPLLTKYWDRKLEGRTVFHCCEPDRELLEFAQKHHIFIGVDGDVTYVKEKAEFIKTIPLEMLVTETDSPYLLPEPLKSQKMYPNEPKNVKHIVGFIAKLLNKSPEYIAKTTTQNSEKLFGFI